MSETRLRRVAWTSFALWGAFVLAQAGLLAATPVEVDTSAFGWSVLTAAFPVSGILILARQPGNRIGWVLMLVGLVSAQPLGAYASFALASGWPGGAVAAIVNGPMWVPSIGLIGTFLLLWFPDGRPPSPRWRTVEWLAAAAIVLPMIVLLFTPGDLGELGYPELRNPLGIEPLRDLLGAALALVFLVPIAIVACVAGLVVRFRRSRGPERQQLKWLTAAASLVAGWYLLGMLLNLVTGSLWGETPAWLGVVDTLSSLLFLLIPIAIGIAVLRYRLYEIDRIISRTLAYATVTAILGATFAGLVLGLQALARPITGSSEVAVAVSTLAVAALFGPLRSRVQAAVDRRFNRSRYDAALLSEGLAGRLRDHVELAAVRTELLATADTAFQPASISVWVRPATLRTPKQRESR